MIAIPVIGVLIGGADICYYEGAYGQSSNAVGYNPTQSANYMRNKQEIGLYGLQNKQLSMDTDGMQ